MFSRPHERTRRTMKLPVSPNATPTSTPPRNAKKKFAVAPTSENVPVTAAAMANWNDTMPEASLMMDSLSKILRERAGIFTCFDSEATDTASVGPSAAPKANAAAKGMDGTSQLTANPMIRAEAMTSPTASDSTGRLFSHSAFLSRFLASSYRSGAMNSTRNRLGSKAMLICVPMTSAMSRPSPIWMRGDDTLGTSWSMTDESSTAASMSSENSRSSTRRLLLHDDQGLTPL